jgi:hypothetical protein
MNSCLSLYKLETFRHNLLYVFILVLQQTKSEGDVIPLPLTLTALQSGSQLR